MVKRQGYSPTRWQSSIAHRPPPKRRARGCTELGNTTDGKAAPRLTASALSQLEIGCKLGVRLLGMQEEQFLGVVAQVGGKKRQSLHIYFFFCLH